jgi:hypothetical protein
MNRKRFFLILTVSSIIGISGLIVNMRTVANIKGFKVVNIAATSELAPSANYNLKAENIMDGNLNNAWVEGKKDDGIGESVRITLSLVG